MRNLNKLAIATALFTAAALPASVAQAATLVVSLSGIQTFGTFQSGLNTVQSFNIGAGAHITGTSYSTTITTVASGSFLSEASIYYTNSAALTGVVTRPGFANANSGTGTYVGSSDLVALGLDFFVGADGILRLEFADSFDDAIGADAIFNSGTITFTYQPVGVTAVPEPATWGMMILGFGMIGAAARSRKVKTSVKFA